MAATSFDRCAECRTPPGALADSPRVQTQCRWPTGLSVHSKPSRREFAIVANLPGHSGVMLLMDTNLLDNKFARIGARLKIAETPKRRNRASGAISLDVQADRKGEFFEIVRAPD